ncbi:MAG: hypothetical protein IJY01_06780 [Clostridia bacterium]|nr:hypothetical protein [Clostridia bacterium]
MKKSRRIIGAMLILSIILSLGVFGFSLVTSAADLGEIDVWLIAGQSNAVGYGANVPPEAEDDHRYFSGFTNTLYYQEGEQFAQDSTDMEYVALGNGQTDFRSGAELGIAKSLDSTGRKNAVIKCAVGATYLFPYIPEDRNSTNVSNTVGTWTSPSYVERANMSKDDPNYSTLGTYLPIGTVVPEGESEADYRVDIPDVDTEITINKGGEGYQGKPIVGNLFRTFITTVTNTVAELREMGYTPVLRGMWWMQGEAECDQLERASLYDELLECLVNDVRDEMAAIFGENVRYEAMPFVAGNVYRNKGIDPSKGTQYWQPPYLHNVNLAQVAVADRLDNVFYLHNGDDAEWGKTVDGYTDQSFFRQQDGWHFDSTTQQYFGEKFVEFVLGIKGEIPVGVRGEGISFTGGGLYKAGERVTLSITPDAGYAINSVTVSVGGGTPTAVTLTDGKYTIEALTDDTLLTVNTTYSGTSLTDTEYGYIIKEYDDAARYPFAVFNEDGFFSAANTWGKAIYHAKYAMEYTGDERVVILMRDNYTSVSGRDATNDKLQYFDGTLLVDLGGKTLKRGTQTLFDFLGNGASAGYKTRYEIKNGTIISGTGQWTMAMESTTDTSSVKSFELEVTNVTFAAEKAQDTPLALVVWINANSPSCGIDLTATYNGCTFDMTYAGSQPLFRVSDVLSGRTGQVNADITVNGGTVIAASNSFTVFSGDAGDSFKVGEYQGSMPKISLPEGTAAPSATYTGTDGKLYATLGGTTESGRTVYTLTEAGVQIGNLGYVPETALTEYFAVFTKDGFYKTASSWAGALTEAKNLINSRADRWACVYLLNDYNTAATDATADIFRTVNGTLVIDLGLKKLSAEGKNPFDIYARKADSAFTTRIEVKNGTLNYGAKWIMALDLASDVETKKKYEFDFTNVTYTSTGDISSNHGLVSVVWNNANTGAGMDVTMDFTDCTFDLSKVTGKHLFRAYDQKDGRSGQVNIVYNVNGGKVINIGTTWMAYGDSKDSIYFNEYNGSYTSFTITKGSKPYDGGGSTNENISTFKNSDGDKLQLTACTAGTDFDTYSFAVSRYTPYGYIAYGDYATESTMPIAVFKPSGTSYTYTLYDAWLAGANAAIGTNGAVIYLRGDVQTLSDAAPSAANVKGTVTVDLNGHTLTKGGNKYIFDSYFGNTSVFYAHIKFKNGTLVKAESANWAGFFCLNYGTGNKALATVDYTFDNVTFINKKTDTLLFSGFENAFNTATTVGTKTTAIFNNCTIEANGATVFELLCTSATDSNKSDYDIIVNGGRFISATAITASNLYNKNADDTVKFGMYDGKYTELLLPSGVAYPAHTAVFEAFGGSELTWLYKSDEDGSKVYSLAPSLVTTYGKIPARYDAATYPFAVFENGSFLGAYTKWTDNNDSDGKSSAFECVKSAMFGKPATDANETATVLLRRNFVSTVGTYDGKNNNFSQLGGTMVLDLGGFSFATDTQPIFNAQAKASSNLIHDTRVIVKNGTMLVGGAPIIRLSQVNADSYNAEKTFYFTFDNVNFGFVQGATEKNVISGSLDASGAKVGVNSEITLNDCDIDMLTNAPDAVRIASVKEVNELVDVRIIISGGTIKAGKLDNAALGYFGTGDSLTFSKSESEGYPLLTLPAGTVPTAKINGGTLTFVRRSADDATVFTLVSSAIAEFKPATSITLEASLVLNVYIPENTALTEFTLDGTTYKAEDLAIEDGKYLVRVVLDAKSSGREIPLTVTFGDEASATYTLSVLKYAEKLLASSTSTAERALVCDMLAYVKSAYAYFGTEGAEEIASAIDALIGDGATEFEKISDTSGNMAVGAGVNGVTFILDAEPKIRFYFAQGTDLTNYSFKIGGVAQEYTETAETIGESTFVCADISLFAYKMIGTVEVYNGSTKLGSFHINDYYDFALTQNNSALIEVVERFYMYCKSAKAYRDEVIAGQ